MKEPEVVKDILGMFGSDGKLVAPTAAESIRKMELLIERKKGKK